MSAVPVEQRTLRLTAHPFQRAGAYVFAVEAQRASPLEVSPEEFDTVCEQHAEDAARASLAGSKDEDGFFQKQSYSLFPNSPMNHPSRFGAGKDPRKATLAWRTIPDTATWPDAVCALCGEAAVNFYGNNSIALAASISHRNTTPDGHDGYPLCWPCTASFFALPYACRLTGGQLSLLHTWDDAFFAKTVRAYVKRNKMHFALGAPITGKSEDARQAAVQRLREYEDKVHDDLELMVFTNYNGKAELVTHYLAEPIAEWVRSTGRGDRLGWFTALLIAHRRPKMSGYVPLARHLFGQPDRLVATATRFAGMAAVGRSRIPDLVTDLAAACRSFLVEVLSMDEKDAAELDRLAHNIASVLMDQSAGALKAFRAKLNDRTAATSLLNRWALDWLLKRKDESTERLHAETFVTRRADRLLFDSDQPGRRHRGYLLISVLNFLHEMGYNPKDAAKTAAELSEEELIPDTETDGDDRELGEDENE